MHGLGRHRRDLDDVRRSAERHAARAGRARRDGTTRQAACASCRSATATSASTSRRTPTSRRRCVRRSPRSRQHPEPPAFVLHTGDLTHLSKPAEFDTLQQVLAELSLPVFYVPGEHDVLDDDGKSYLQRFGKGTRGAGWHSFDQRRRALHRPGQRGQPEGGRPRHARPGATRWLEKDVKRSESSTPIVVFAHIPLWTVYPEWGWGTDDSAQALSYSEAVRLGVGAQWPHPPGDAEGRRARHFHTAMSTAFPQPAPGTRRRPDR